MLINFRKRPILYLGDPPNPNSNISQVNDGDLDRDTLLNLTRKVVDTVQLGALESVINVTVLGVDVQEPLPPPESKFYFLVAFAFIQHE